MAEKGCIFCGKTPTTNEHVISRWVAPVLIQDPRKVAPDSKHWRKGKGSQQSWKATTGTIDFQANCVCADCNHGWMNDIETAAKASISEMIRGRHIMIGPKEDEAIGKWLCLKAIIEQYAQSPPIPVDKEVRNHFYLHHEPPSSWYAWITRYKGNHPVYYHSGGMTAQYTPPLGFYPLTYTGLVFTVAIGYFAAKVFGLSQTIALETSPDLFLCVWPPPRLRPKAVQRGQGKRRSWPPRLWIDDRRLEELGKGLPEFVTLNVGKPSPSVE